MAENIIVLQTDKLATVLAGAAFVILGVSINNGSKQQGIERPMYGVLSFVGGWALVVLGLGFDSWAPIGAMMVIGAVLLKESTYNLSEMTIGVIFALGWVLVGYAAIGQSIDFSSARYYLGLAAVLCVFLSMMWVLPIERANNVTDSIGMPLFTAAWVLLAMAAAWVE